MCYGMLEIRTRQKKGNRDNPVPKEHSNGLHMLWSRLCTYFHFGVVSSKAT